MKCFVPELLVIVVGKDEGDPPVWIPTAKVQILFLAVPLCVLVVRSDNVELVCATVIFVLFAHILLDNIGMFRAKI